MVYCLGYLSFGGAGVPSDSRSQDWLQISKGERKKSIRLDSAQIIVIIEICECDLANVFFAANL
jgi:hypothetical protein